MRHIDQPQIYLNPKKVSKSLQVAPNCPNCNQKKVLKLGITYTKQNPKGKALKVQSYSYSKSIKYLLDTPVT